jgi:glycosyltransferase involved in cell wall biosynthesis
VTDAAAKRVGRRGDAALDRVDRDALASFQQRYRARPGAPVVVVIAAYNEEPSVARVVGAIPTDLCGKATQVIVVVDGAEDETAAKAEAAGALVCDVAVNRGQGAALRLGYALARARGAEIILTTDADGQYSADDMERVVQPILDGTADFVSGSRRLGAHLSSDSVRKAGVVVFARVISVLTRQPVTDPSCGLRAMRAGVTAAVVLDQPQYQASELLIGAAMAGYRIQEVPITMRDRHVGASKKGGNVRYARRFASVVLGTWWREVRGSTKTTNS